MDDPALETLQPTPTWDEDAHERTVDAFAALADDGAVEIRIWGADWCPDCRSALPDLAAALGAAGFPDDRLHVHPVDREKDGDLVEAYGVEFVPTVVIERDGEELARFVEGEPVSAPEYLADEVRDAV